MKCMPVLLYALVGWFGLFALPAPVPAGETPEEDPVAAATRAYFATNFARLKAVADQNPTKDTFRKAMQPLAEATPGFFGGTYIDSDFVIREVYNPRDFLARGYDLKKVRELDYFWKLMRKTPAPQLSEPAHGNIMQPRLIALRYPVLKEGRLAAVVSIMIRTEAFLAAVGLDQATAYRITCRGVVAEEKGDLGATPRTCTLELPSTEWKIEYVRP